MSDATPTPVRIGVSSCLLGNPVRYDGGHKRDRFVTDVLGAHVEWVVVCPEAEAGLGTPRPTMQLRREGDALRVVESKSGRDHTRALTRFSRYRRAFGELPETERAACLGENTRRLWPSLAGAAA